ncbi:hypothetical protein SVIOM74S_05503 [Streptomyces violarus]
MNWAHRFSCMGWRAVSADSSGSRPAVPAQPQVGLHAGLQDAEPALLQARHLHADPHAGVHVHERVSAP